MPKPKPPIHLLDGGLGTLLADSYSCTFDTSTPLWSSHLLLSESGQKTLLAAQSSFATAGADVILSGTYQASFTGFASSGVTSKTEAGKLMRDGVSIAKAAAGNGKVALSLGAYGATMIPGAEYSGAYDEERRSVKGLREWHLERIEAFKECWDEVEYVAFETLPRIEEVRAVREVMGEVGKKAFWIACVFPGEGNRLPDGSSVREVVDAMLEGEGRMPVAIGINCTRVGKVEGLVEEFAEAVKVLGREGEVGLVLYPDGTKGEVYNTSTKEWEKVEGVEQSEVSLDCLFVWHID